MKTRSTCVSLCLYVSCIHTFNLFLCGSCAGSSAAGVCNLVAGKVAGAIGALDVEILSRLAFVRRR